MCGILFTSSSNINLNQFQSALRLMDHRGPDASGVYAHKNFRLGSNRLKIFDLDDRSNQPFWSHDRRYVMVFNGAIYNYQELAKQFGIQRRTSSDTEVLLELYALKGPEILKLLNGMFAFVIVDTVKDEIFIARDRLGVKPLYIAKEGSVITAASEIASVIELTGKANFDPDGLRQYRKLRTFFNGRTAYQGIEMFPAGHYMLDGKITRYWSFPEGEQTPPTDEELRNLVETAVSYRCLSDVPVGSYLSGGLDSTIVAALASKPDTWTVGFEDCNEFEWAQMASKNCKSVHSEVQMTKQEFVDLAKQMIEKRREPLSVPNEVLLYRMTQEVRKKNTVVLSGEGADELFFGYDRIFKWAAEEKWDLEKFNELYSYGSQDDLEIVEDAVSPFLKYKKPIWIVAAFFQVAHLHGLLRRLDNSTMLCSVEARVPFVDYRLVERMAGVSFEYRMEGGVIKAPLKRIFKDLLPKEIIERKKIGFPVPLENMPFPQSAGVSPMDNWLLFNLAQLDELIYHS